jgi:hypothetical protein
MPRCGRISRQGAKPQSESAQLHQLNALEWFFASLRLCVRLWFALTKKTGHDIGTAQPV